MSSVCQLWLALFDIYKTYEGYLGCLNILSLQVNVKNYNKVKSTEFLS